MIWVIGCRGMLGSELCYQLSESGRAYTATDKEVDITDEATLASFAGQQGIDWMVNCCAYTAVDRAEQERSLAFRVNAQGTGNLAAVARRLDVPLLHISTDYVFPGNVDAELKETDPTGPLGVYGMSKLQGEEKLRQTWQRHYILRTAWLYGKRGNNFVHTMLAALRSRDRVEVVNDQVGSPTNAADLAAAIIFILEAGSSRYGLYHFSGEGRTTWFAFAGRIYALARQYGIIGKDCSIEAVPSSRFPAGAARPAFSLLSKEKIKQVFGMEVPHWQDSLARFFAANREYLREMYS